MRKGLAFSIFLTCGVAAFWLLLTTGCANIVPPSGGPRDSIPPRLVRADPPDSNVNFRGNRITLTFDEYVDLKEVASNLIFSPTFETNPVVQVKGHTVVVPFKDSLLPKTTYVLNFGNAIVDMNEGNPLRDFTYTFSTGPALDSLEISGRVLLAETGELDTTLTAVLHRSLTDSAVTKQRPIYAVRLDRNGAFRFRNLPPDTFAIYVLGDAGYSRRYSNGEQLFAFANAPVVAGRTDSLLLYAYRETPKRPQTEATPTRIPASDRRLRFTQGTTGLQDLLSNFTLSFATPLRSFDSTKVSVTTDSAFNRTAYRLTLDTARQLLTLSADWKENTRYNIVLDKDFAADTSGRQLLKTDTLFFTTRKAADYGSVQIRLRNFDTARQPVLQFVQNGTVVFAVPVPRSGIITQSRFLPGEYNLRILYDTNGNGKWDPGKFYGARRQPEIVRPIDRTIKVTANFENEVEIAL